MHESRVTEQAIESVDKLLDLHSQVWLLGAGVSKDAKIPLMTGLTTRVEQLLEKGDACLETLASDRSNEIYQAVKSELPKTCHVEHLLSQFGDLIAIANRKEKQEVQIGKKTFSGTELREAHRHVQLAIRHTVEFGYVPKQGTVKEEIGTPSFSIVDQSLHDAFVEALFAVHRAGLEHNPAVRFVTTNYDTLLEDALSRAHVACVDGFSGGSTAFWDPGNLHRRLEDARRASRHTATICKLHGSIDWVGSNEGIVTRVRSSAIDPDDPTQNLLIYPQATKYQVTQRDPFATLFSDFRSSLASNAPTLLAICGYSFGDDHINEEIERALRNGPKGLSILAFCMQWADKNDKLGEKAGMPSVLAKWLESEAFKDRVFVCGSRGFYRGSLVSRLPEKNYDWWKFNGVSKILRDGVEGSL